MPPSPEVSRFRVFEVLAGNTSSVFTCSTMFAGIAERVQGVDASHSVSTVPCGFRSTDIILHNSDRYHSTDIILYKHTKQKYAGTWKTTREPLRRSRCIYARAGRRRSPHLKAERKYSTWIGGAVLVSLSTFQHLSGWYVCIY